MRWLMKRIYKNFWRIQQAQTELVITRPYPHHETQSAQRKHKILPRIHPVVRKWRISGSGRVNAMIALMICYATLFSFTSVSPWCIGGASMDTIGEYLPELNGKA